MGNLNENSKAYHENNDYYEIFSQAEDYPRLIDKKIKKYLKNQSVLDAGCGTGKYASTIRRNCKKYLGIDKSKEQIRIAKEKIGDSFFKVEDLVSINYAPNSYDVVISCWCLGTITEDKRKVVLENLKSVSKDKIVLIENLCDSEFEIIRGHDKDGKTAKYNNWLEDNGFVLEETIDTYFMFENFDIAKETFETIYNKEIAEKVTSNVIGHKVGIFVWRKKYDL